MIMNPFSVRKAATRPATRTLRRGKHSMPRGGGPFAVGLFLAAATMVYCLVVLQTFQHQTPKDNESEALQRPTSSNQTMKESIKSSRTAEQEVEIAASPLWLHQKRSTFQEWREFVSNLAALPPDEILSILENQDPFGVRGVEEELLLAESDKQAILSLSELSTIFSCPTQDRITLPDVRNHTRAQQFRQGTDDFSFLFFQHLRKAGGTNFCSLAQHNLPKSQVPSYYCMPDMFWEDKRCAGCLKKYTNEDMASRLRKENHRIVGNEWDPFDDRFFDLPAVFATSFRKPLDRGLSQYRFECVEGRGCKFKDVEPWWEARKDLTNVYLWTFSQRPSRSIRRMTVGTEPEDATQRQEAMLQALDTIAKYNLVLVMEWLAYAPEHVRDVLGFEDTSTMTQRIRPHISQAKRDDGQEQNNLGAAGIAKASWTPKDFLTPEQYQRMSHDLALDEILTDAARRIFLERIVCDDMAERNQS